jgi:hypothetical protein
MVSSRCTPTYCYICIDWKAKLANSTEAELKSLQSSLRQVNDDTTGELQRNVFEKYITPFFIPYNYHAYMYFCSYAEFVHTSKEISALENEILELKEALSEWKSMSSLLQVENSTTQFSLRARGSGGPREGKAPGGSPSDAGHWPKWSFLARRTNRVSALSSSRPRCSDDDGT